MINKLGDANPDFDYRIAGRRQIDFVFEGDFEREIDDTLRLCRAAVAGKDTRP